MLTYTIFSDKTITLCRGLAIITAIAAPVSTAVTSIASVGFLLTWLISGLAAQSLKISFQHPVGKVILLFFLWLIIGTLYADTDLDVKIATILSWQKLFFVFILLGVFYQEQWQRRFVYSYVIFMVVAAIIAIPLWLFDLNVRPGSTGPGIFMTNWSSQSIAFVAALVCCLFLIKNSMLSVLQKRYIWTAIILFIFNILFISSSRSGYLALLAAVFFVGVYFYGYKKLPQILTALLAILLIVGFSSTRLQERLKLAVNEQHSYQSSSNETSIGLRMVFYKNTLELIKEKPIFGYGTSSFEKTYSAYAASKFQDWHGIKTGDPHNQYLFVLLENGLIGLILFLAYIYVAIRQGLKTPPYGPMAAGFLVAICASSLFNSHFKTFPEGNLLAFFMGMLLAARQSNTVKPNDNA